MPLKKFEIGKLYYTYSTIDEGKEEFVGKYLGFFNDKGGHVFENSKGEKKDAVYGYHFEEATPEQIKSFY